MTEKDKSAETKDKPPGAEEGPEFKRHVAKPGEQDEKTKPEGQGQKTKG